ncbi:hypothetical protein [Kribbella sp. NPDC049584]|uniref:hypothetical protein n=1 Tax=Kribbella sp. NPDC049584 TaxID=3154833 RepID=UPI003430DAAD
MSTAYCVPPWAFGVLPVPVGPAYCVCPWRVWRTPHVRVPAYCVHLWACGVLGVPVGPAYCDTGRGGRTAAPGGAGAYCGAGRGGGVLRGIGRCTA